MLPPITTAWPRISDEGLVWVGIMRLSFPSVLLAWPGGGYGRVRPHPRPAVRTRYRAYAAGTRCSAARRFAFSKTLAGSWSQERWSRCPHRGHSSASRPSSSDDGLPVLELARPAAVAGLQHRLSPPPASRGAVCLPSNGMMRRPGIAYIVRITQSGRDRQDE